ncbi:PREDICTED: major facilitator superfamily domain-containing protein 6-like [Gavialis gangeticus]|uniref:major facilitator superfamily domain-containing protein 6-like n=1 Tax=Gavialis gangeticus TaxID=94835 RepID=UPI00092F111D|nr:PREDICTED: major facilitator superfamily domain-containing protein 6-like [Gavialis gangeticus]
MVKSGGGGRQHVAEATSTNQQWDVHKALAVAGVFYFLHGAGNACVAPFLSLYCRQLGLPAPLVGIVMGIKHLVSCLWAPLASYLAKSRGKRKVLITASLLGSVGAGLLLTLVPPLSREALYRYCNISHSSPGATADVGTSNASSNAVAMGNGVQPAVSKAAFQQSIGFTDLLEEKDGGVGKDDKTADPHMGGASGVMASVQLKQVAQELDTPPSNERQFNQPEQETSSPGSRVLKVNDNPDENFPMSGSSELSLFQTNPRPVVGTSYVFENLSGRWEEAQDVNLELLPISNFLDREHQVFLMVLGAVVFWELLAAPLEWTVDDSLYEYLDFVDATDRYGNLWIWSYLGASGGACSIAILVDQLNCFLNTEISRLAVHFYGYALLITLTLLVSVFFPIHVSRKTEHVNKTVKALNLIGSDGRTILSAVTVFLTGVIGSTVQNFLFWQMQDQGSRELYMGLSVAIGLIAEILLHFFKSRLLRTLSSSGTVALSLSCLALQLLYYSFLWNAWAVLPIQILSAFSNGSLWWAVNMMVDDVATPGTERALHIVLQGLSYGCGASLGSFAGGFVVSNFGLTVLYRACCISLILWLILFLIVQSKLPRQKKINYSRLLAADLSDVSDSDEERERDWLVKAMKDEHFSRNW